MRVWLLGLQEGGERSPLGSVRDSASLAHKGKGKAHALNLSGNALKTWRGAELGLDGFARFVAFEDFAISGRYFYALVGLAIHTNHNAFSHADDVSVVGVDSTLFKFQTFVAYFCDAGFDDYVVAVVYGFDKVELYVGNDDHNTLLEEDGFERVGKVAFFAQVIIVGIHAVVNMTIGIEIVETNLYGGFMAEYR